jgi:hypothetical protein
MSFLHLHFCIPQEKDSALKILKHHSSFLWEFFPDNLLWIHAKRIIGSLLDQNLSIAIRDLIQALLSANISQGHPVTLLPLTSKLLGYGYILTLRFCIHSSRFRRVGAVLCRKAGFLYTPRASPSKFYLYSTDITNRCPNSLAIFCFPFRMGFFMSNY